MNLNIASNTKEALLAAEQAITKLFKLQDGVIEALEQVADVLQKMAAKTEAQYGEVHPHLKNLREAIALVDKCIDKEIDAGIDRHDAKAAQPAATPAPQGCAPEGIAPPADQVPAPGAAAAEASAEESSAVEPASLKEELEALDAADDSRAGKVITAAALANYSEQAAPEPSFEEMQAKLLEVARALGNDEVSNILAGADAWSAADVPPWKRADVIKACDEAIVADESGEAGWEE